MAETSPTAPLDPPLFASPMAPYDGVALPSQQRRAMMGALPASGGATSGHHRTQQQQQYRTDTNKSPETSKRLDDVMMQYQQQQRLLQHQHQNYSTATGLQPSQAPQQSQAQQQSQQIPADSSYNNYQYATGTSGRILMRETQPGGKSFYVWVWVCMLVRLGNRWSYGSSVEKANMFFSLSLYFLPSNGCTPNGE